MIVQFTVVKDLSGAVARYTVLQSVQDGRDVYAAVHEDVTRESLPKLISQTEADFTKRAGRDLFARNHKRG